MIRTLRGTTTHCRPRLLIGLAMAASLAVAVGDAPSAHAASPPIGCLPACAILPLPTLAVSASQYSSTGTATVTLTGQNYTPGGAVDIFVPVQFGGAVGTLYEPVGATTASTPLYVCNPFSHTCHQTPGGSILVTVTTDPRFPGCSPAKTSALIAWDAQSGTWSNAVPC